MNNLATASAAVNPAADGQTATAVTAGDDSRGCRVSSGITNGQLVAPRASAGTSMIALVKEILNKS